MTTKGTLLFEWEGPRMDRYEYHEALVKLRTAANQESNEDIIREICEVNGTYNKFALTPKGEAEALRRAYDAIEEFYRECEGDNGVYRCYLPVTKPRE